MLLKKNECKRKTETRRRIERSAVAAAEEEEEEEVDELEQRKRQQSRRKGRKGRREEEEEEPDIDGETENNENDLILNVVEGSDRDEEDKLEHVIPRLKTIDRMVNVFFE